MPNAANSVAGQQAGGSNCPVIRTHFHGGCSGMWPMSLSVTFLAAALSACSTSPQLDRDGGPAQDIDVSNISDAVPRVEPRSRYGNPPSYVVNGKRYYVMESSHGYVERGIASWYGTKFHGRRTSSGEPYDMYAMTAAHKTLPLPAYARVTNLRNGQSVVVKINDRGPFHENRVIDLSYAAAKKLGITGVGTGLVEVEVIKPGESQPDSSLARKPQRPAQEPELYLQVGAFTSESNAQRLSKRLQEMQLTAVSVTPAYRDKQRIFRVRIGPVESVEQADHLSEVLVQGGIEHPHVVID
jgi:rare lipoprotein A